MSCKEAGRLGQLISAEKQQKQKAERIATYNQHPKRCKLCNNVFDYAHRTHTFCDRACAATFNNRIRPKGFANPYRKHIRVERESAYCRNCGAATAKSYCSPQCFADYQWEQKKIKIREAGEFQSGFGGEASRRAVRRFLTERDGHVCQICGGTEWMGEPIPLVVDHIDGNSQNSKVENFRLVCGNCDMQLPTYKSKNKFGRAWRNKRRADGKSC